MIAPTLNRPTSANPPLAKTRRGGWTLPEMMISVGVGTLILASVLTVMIFMVRTLDATGNYSDLDRQSRNALDRMTREIRNSGDLTNYTATTMSFLNQNGTSLNFTYNTNTQILSFTNTDSTAMDTGGTLLKGCTFLQFNFFQRNPASGTTMTFTNTSTANQVKVIVINWICRRTNYLTLTDSESIQTAKVVLRN